METTQVVKEIIDDSCLTARLYSNNIVEIEWNDCIEEIEIKHLKRMQEIVGEIGGGQKMALYYSTHEFLGITKEARKYATTPEGTRHSLVIAVLVNNLGMKLLFNFFMRVNKPKVKTKGFKNKEEAFEWLESVSVNLKKVS